MKLSDIFTVNSTALHWQNNDMELAVIPDLNTVRVNSRLFKFDAALSEIDFCPSPAELRYSAGSTGFSFLLPPELAGLVLRKMER